MRMNRRRSKNYEEKRLRGSHFPVTRRGEIVGEREERGCYVEEEAIGR